MVSYIFNEYKKIFFKVKKRNYNRFLGLFHRLQFSISVKDPARNPSLKRKTKKAKKVRQKVYLNKYFFL